MHTQRLANNRIQDRHIFEVLVLHQTQRAILLLANPHLFLIQLLLHVGSGREVQEGPRARRAGGVLASHQERDHDMRHLDIGQHAAVPVLLLRQRREHVVLVLVVALAARADDLLVELGHCLLCPVAPPVAREGEVGEEQVDRLEPTIKIGIPLRERLVQPGTDFGALERTRGGEDDKLSHGVQAVKGTPFVCWRVESLEVGIGLEHLGRLFLDHVRVNTEVFSRETKFDEFLLLHEHFVRAVVYDVLAKNGCGDILGRHSAHQPSLHKSREVEYRTEYTSSAQTWVGLPPRIKLLPFGPRQTVTLRPSSTNVKTSPYYE